MKFLFTTLFVVVLCTPLAAQGDVEVVAAASGFTVSLADLSTETRAAYDGRNASMAALRTRLLSEMIADYALRLEADARKTTVDALIAEAVSKITPPTDEMVKTVYDANRQIIGPKTLDEMRKPIAEFLVRDARQKTILSLTKTLKKKFKASLKKDVNDPDLSPKTVIAEIGGQSITSAMFEEQYRIELNDAEMELFDNIRAEAEDLLFNALLLREARDRGITPEEIIRPEITEKLREPTTYEREKLDFDLRSRLFSKYDAKFLLKKPSPLILDVSTANEPSLGESSAPVTVVMFSDFQCPACAATDPVLKKIIEGYGSRVRLVVRDFPLESIHPDAFRAALAANAAWKQGKFFEYTKLLYRNQDKLSHESLIDFARGLGLDVARFGRDMDDPETAAEIRGDIAEGEKLKVSGTPTIFVNGVKVHRLSSTDFRNAIETALTGK